MMVTRLDLTNELKIQPSLKGILRNYITQDTYTKIIFYNIPPMNANLLNELVSLNIWLSNKYETRVNVLFQDENS